MNHIRPVNIVRDLPAIADLIELCFGQTMDEDGWEYVRQLRQSARDARYLTWALGLMESDKIPISGFVYEENDVILGNLTLIPIHQPKRKMFLIANVAVRPEYRKRGIGRLLTQSAVNYAHDHQANSCWLQVRVDNPGAEHLYSTLGFIERARRTTWLYRPDEELGFPGADIQLGPLTMSVWGKTARWLDETYPASFRWNLTIKPERLRPGFTNWLDRVLRSEPMRSWAAYQNQQLVGALFWEPSRLFSDNLWLAADPQFEEQVTAALLPTAVMELRSRKPLGLNYPARVDPDYFLNTGFSHHLSLIWMEKPLTPPLETTGFITSL